MGQGGQVEGFVTLVVTAELTSLVFCLAFAFLRVRGRDIFFAARPKGAVASAESYGAWFKAAYSLTANDAHEHTGLDGALWLRRAALHVRAAALLCGLTPPLMLCYGLCGPRRGGFDRVTLGNVFSASKDSRNGWAWVGVAACWATHCLFLYLLADADADAHLTIADAHRKPKAHHYVVLVSGLAGDAQADAAAAAVDAAAGRRCALAVNVAANQSAPVPEDADKGDETEVRGSKGRFSALVAPDGGVRERTNAFMASLGAVGGADKALAASQAAEAKRAASSPRSADAEDSEPPKGCCASGLVEAPAAKGARRRVEANERRLKVSEAHAFLLGPAPPHTGAAFVVCDSLEAAAAAAHAPRGATRVLAAPEPRDVIWTLVEKLRPFNAQRGLGFLGCVVKAASFTFFAAICAVVLLGLIALVLFVQRVVPAATPIVQAVMPLLEVIVYNFLLGFMATVIRDFYAPTFDGTWTKSQAELLVQRDYTTFLLMVAYLVRMIGPALFSALTALGSNPVSVFGLLATGVTDASFVFLTFIFFKAAAAVNGGSQVVRYIIISLQLKYLTPPTKFLERQLAKPQEAQIAVSSAWDTFVLVSLLTYAPFAPLVSVVCVLYFLAVEFFQKQDACAVCVRPFSCEGRLWQLYAQQASTCQNLALFVHILVFAFAGLPWATIGLLPLVPLAFVARRRVNLRACGGVFGAARRGRLAAADAENFDAAHKGLADDVAAAAAAACAWQAPCAPRPAAPEAALGVVLTDFAEDADDASDRQAALDAWLKRTAAADFTALPWPAGDVALDFDLDVESDDAARKAP
ncbi:hypothetical protein M885DRAFT_586967 [Pelagophyceae sp. CCMP2097]|nr:hypothetical protein M885DRAFT_586967 [Pelagophyceae sp. CCMP2097]